MLLGREAWPSQPSRSPSKAVQASLGSRADWPAVGRRCRISDGARRRSCGCCPRLMAGIGPRSLPSPCHPIRRAPTASSLALWGPGTAHPALSRPLLRTLTLPAVARDGDDNFDPVPASLTRGRQHRPRRASHGGPNPWMGARRWCPGWLASLAAPTRPIRLTGGAGRASPATASAVAGLEDCPLPAPLQPGSVAPKPTVAALEQGRTRCWRHP